MLNHNRYFEEHAVPPSGIDTVSVWIHPNLINNFGDFHECGNIHSAVNCRKTDEKDYRTGKTIRQNYHLEIQSEALHPNLDILGQVLHLLVEMVNYGTLKISQNMDRQKTAFFFSNAFPSLFAIDALDFYFDFKEEDVVLLGRPNPEYPNTLYSQGYPASLKTYSKTIRQMSKNHLPHEDIKSMEYPRRIEFHLERQNCKYLDHRNLRGNFEAVFLNYLPFLARKWFDHHREVFDVPIHKHLPYAHHFRQIVMLALSGPIPQYRYLFQSPKKPMPGKHYKQGEADMNWLSEFITQ